jgi:hypothetical protein
MEPFAHHDDWDIFFDAIVFKKERPPLDDKTFLVNNNPQHIPNDNNPNVKRTNTASGSTYFE